jgi:hypothetical protein
LHGGRRINYSALLTSVRERGRNMIIDQPLHAGGFRARQAEPMTQAIDQLSINTIRMLSIDAVQKANSGHPGAPMGLAPVGLRPVDALSQA